MLKLIRKTEYILAGSKHQKIFIDRLYALLSQGSGLPLCLLLEYLPCLLESVIPYILKQRLAPLD